MVRHAGIVSTDRDYQVTTKQINHGEIRARDLMVGTLMAISGETP